MCEHAQQDSNKYSFDQQTLADTKAVTLTTDTPTESGASSRSSTLRELLTKTAGKLGKPPTSVGGSSFLTAFLPHKSENANKKQFGTMTMTFEDIIATVVEQNIASPAIRHDRTLQINRAGQIVAPSVQHTLTETSVLYPDVPHSWLQDGRLLRLHDPQHRGNFRIFQEQWLRGEPVLVSSVHKTLNADIWKPEWFGNKFGNITNDLVNCLTGSVIQGHEMKDFWDGFQDMSNRLVTKEGDPMSLKLKDWPPTEDFAEILPEHFADLMHNLPLPEYTNRDGKLNLSSRLPDFFVKPDLGPKMYNAYGNCQYPELGTTNLHLDISDAVNVMVHVAVPKGDPESDVTTEDLEQAGIKIIDAICTDEQTRRRVRDGKEKVGAIWHIFRAEDAVKIRELLNKVARERGEDIPDDHDPIHDQSWYLDKMLLERLHKEHGVQGWAIAQCHGDAVFIPGGAPHQVQNLQSCIKVAEDFVSPEHISQCFNLTQEFRKLSDTHSNHEDKLQIKNMIYHAVKDAAGVLVSQEVTSTNAT
ncbi:lysine-specific demethylase 3B-like [Amphiura filiformis]|uniref:lysine-specific demethylase 3B-like n=1 Tax=Amphiura filiformis TaxID=82378 RepID=UPI003B225122